MRNGFRQKAMNLLLSALVLAWGFVPPGFEHAHAGGDSDHQHDQCREVSHHGSHHHDADDEHHEHAAEPEDTDGTLLVEFALHFHWQLLGVEFSMPVPTEPADGDDGGPVPPVVVRVMSEIVPATQAGLAFGRALLAANCAPSADVVRNLEPIPRPPNLVTSIPLCDSARLERSGVLLV
jgi:hypothetical protein